MRERREVLEEVNRVFTKYGLPLWKSLKRIGKHREGEFEITSVINVWDDVQQYFVIIQFSIIRPDGTKGVYAVRFQRPAAIVVLIVNKKVVLVKQHRLPVGGWTLEHARGWLPVEPDWESDNSFDPADLIIRRELGDEFIDTLQITHYHRFTPVHEDTGTRASSVGIHLVIGESNISLPSKVDYLKFTAQWTWDEFLQNWDESQSNPRRHICRDLHSQAAIFQVERHLRARPEVAALLK